MSKRRHAPLRTAILELLGQRQPGATICPSEAARKVAPACWRELMEETRVAAFDLVAEGEIEICQEGKSIDPAAGIKGPIRLRKVGA